jgi:hypothetical protein
MKTRIITLLGLAITLHVGCASAPLTPESSEGERSSAVSQPLECQKECAIDCGGGQKCKITAGADTCAECTCQADGKPWCSTKSKGSEAFIEFEQSAY